MQGLVPSENPLFVSGQLPELVDCLDFGIQTARTAPNPSGVRPLSQTMLEKTMIMCGMPGCWSSSSTLQKDIEPVDDERVIWWHFGR